VTPLRRERIKVTRNRQARVSWASSRPGWRPSGRPGRSRKTWRSGSSRSIRPQPEAEVWTSRPSPMGRSPVASEGRPWSAVPADPEAVGERRQVGLDEAFRPRIDEGVAVRDQQRAAVDDVQPAAQRQRTPAGVAHPLGQAQGPAGAGVGAQPVGAAPDPLQHGPIGGDGAAASLVEPQHAAVAVEHGPGSGARVGGGAVRPVEGDDLVGIGAGEVVLGPLGRQVAGLAAATDQAGARLRPFSGRASPSEERTAIWVTSRATAAREPRVSTNAARPLTASLTSRPSKAPGWIRSTRTTHGPGGLRVGATARNSRSRLRVGSGRSCARRADRDDRLHVPRVVQGVGSASQR
jgi:hypothetical protein